MTLREYPAKSYNLARAEPPEQVVLGPPPICAEILFSEDRFFRMLEKLKDYDPFGVSYVRLPDLSNRAVYRAKAGPLRPWTELRTENTETGVPVEAFFE